MAKKSRKKKKNQKQKKSLIGGLIKWLFVLGIWAELGVCCLITWYAIPLPEMIENVRLERQPSVTFKSQDGQIIARYGGLKGTTVNVDDLPPHLIYAVLATEDRRFYQHNGLDSVGILRALVINTFKGNIVQGGSTITQQLAKNLFLNNGRTYKRKIQEVLLAFWLEQELTKDEILTAYLNRVYFGAGAYGIEAAAQTYFGKSSIDLSLYESAVIAGLLKAPSYYAPHRHPERAAKRARVVLMAMNTAGYITEAKFNSLTEDSLGTLTPDTYNEDNDRYFTDWVMNDIEDIKADTTIDLVVHTTLDPFIQQVTVNTLNRYLRDHQDLHVTQGAAVVMDLSGNILAMAGGRDYNRSQFNRATQARRPPGSAFKPLIFLAAFEQGKKPDDKILDGPLEDQDYNPQNFDEEYEGEITLRDALVHSRNVPAVRLLQETGIKNTISLAKKLGIASPLPHDLSLALGSPGISLLEMVRAYATIANNGQAVHIQTVLDIQDEAGGVMFQPRPPRKHKQIVSAHSVATLRSIMEDVIRDGTGKAARLPHIQAAGKTGTSQDHRDAWFIGFTNDYVVGVWLGNDDNSPMEKITGGNMPAQIWHDILFSISKK